MNRSNPKMNYKYINIYIYIMKKSDFIYSSVLGDGACFFHSIAYILTMEEHNNENEDSRDYKIATSFAKNGNALSRKLRRECVSWLEQNLDYTISQIGRTIRQEIQEEVDNCINTNGCEKYNTISTYLTYMRKYKSYAGQIEIYALSYKLGRSIRVFTERNGKYKTSGLGFMIGLDPDLLDDIHIFHNSGNKNLKPNQYHFDALFPKKKYMKDMKDKSTKKNNTKETTRKKTTRKKPTRKKTTRKKTTRKKTTRKKPTRKKPTRKKTTRKKTTGKKSVYRRGSRRGPRGRRGSNRNKLVSKKSSRRGSGRGIFP